MRRRVLLSGKTLIYQYFQLKLTRMGIAVPLPVYFIYLKNAIFTHQFELDRVLVVRVISFDGYLVSTKVL